MLATIVRIKNVALGRFFDFFFYYGLYKGTQVRNYSYYEFLKAMYNETFDKPIKPEIIMSYILQIGSGRIPILAEWLEQNCRGYHRQRFNLKTEQFEIAFSRKSDAAMYLLRWKIEIR